MMTFSTPTAQDAKYFPKRLAALAGIESRGTGGGSGLGTSFAATGLWRRLSSPANRCVEGEGDCSHIQTTNTIPIRMNPIVACLSIRRMLSVQMAHFKLDHIPRDGTDGTCQFFSVFATFLVSRHISSGRRWHTENTLVRIGRCSTEESGRPGVCIPGSEKSAFASLSSSYPILILEQSSVISCSTSLSLSRLGDRLLDPL